MAERSPGIDFANLPVPDEGILVTLFITVRKVARSRDFYSRVLGGTVVMDENPCMVKLSMRITSRESRTRTVVPGESALRLATTQP